MGTTRANPAVRHRLTAAAVLATGIVLVGCSPAPGTANVATPQPSTAAPPSATASTPASATEIRVPDAFTAITVRPLSAATFPFLTSDGKYHIVYDLELTNASRVPATIERVDVVDAATPATVLASYSGTALVAPDCPYGDCNRLRRLPSAPATDAGIPAQESRALFVDFALDSLDKAPKAVLHRLHGTGAINPGSTAPAPVDYLAAPLDVAAGTPRVIGPPVKGDRWVALNGCCLPGFPHRTSLSTFNGMLVNGQRFAIDWKQANENGEFYTGDRTKNESYVDYGAPIYAVADGTISTTLDTLDPNPPGVLPAADPVLGPKITVETVDGNNIVQDIGGGAYAFYAHLQKGSLLREAGRSGDEGPGDREARQHRQRERLAHALPPHGRAVRAGQRRPALRHRPLLLRRAGRAADDPRRRRLPQRAVPAGQAPDAGAADRPTARGAGDRQLPRVSRYGRISYTRLNGVSAARRNRVNPASAAISRTAASPACAPRA